MDEKNQRLYLKTADAVTQVLSQAGVISELMLSDDALKNLKPVAELVAKHHLNLVKIHFIGAGEIPYSFGEVTSLVTAIQDCPHLKTLLIENFKANLQDGVSAFAQLPAYLPKLTTLSFKNTYLGSRIVFLNTAFTTTAKIECLDLSNCALVWNDHWVQLWEILGKSPWLKTLFLGESPIWIDAWSILQAGVYSPKSGLHFLHWTPRAFQDNEQAYINLRKGANWPNDNQENVSIRCDEQSLETYKTTHRHSAIYGYQTACAQIPELQTYLESRRKPPHANRLIIPIRRSNTTINDLAATIALYKDTVTELELNFEGVDQRRYYAWKNVKDLIEAIRSCTRLESLRIENFKEVFESGIADLLQGMGAEELIVMDNEGEYTETRAPILPRLRSLTFSNTYLGERGAEALKNVLICNTIQELYLINTAFINDNCFLHLVKALACTDSLKLIRFGSSPMTLGWIYILANYVNRTDRQRLPEKIEWLWTPLEMMQENLKSMCDGQNARLYANIDLEFCYQKILQEYSGQLVNKWWLFSGELLKLKLKPPQDVSNADRDLIQSIIEGLDPNRKDKEQLRLDRNKEGSLLNAAARASNRSYGGGRTP